MTEAISALAALSDELAGAVESASQSVVTVLGRRRGPATGVVWQPGLVVTADHVVERDEGITVRLADGRTVAASLAGRDGTTDLAILTLPEDAYSIPPVRTNGAARVGQLALALGRTHDGVSASFGAISVISGPWRTWAGGKIDALIRPEVTFYAGFSGGPLVDAGGAVLGINTSGVSHSGPVTIPSSTVARVVQQLQTSGRVRPGYLGVRLQGVTLPEDQVSRHGLSGPQGLLVISVEPQGPGAAGGILLGDVLVAIDGTPVGESESVHAILDPDTVGKPVSIQLIRGGEAVQVSVVVGERPADHGHPHGDHGREHGHHREHGRGRRHGH